MADKVVETTPIETRKDVIAAAAAAVEEPTSEKRDEKKTTEETPSGETKEQKESREAEEAQLIEQGKQLILALKDPEKSGIVIKFLAEQAGYTKLPETKKGIEEVKEDIQSILEESLGDEFKFLAAKLAPGIEKALTKKLEESQADIRKRFEEAEADKLRNQSAAALDKLTEGFFGAGEELPSKVVDEMSKFMDRVPPSPDSTVKEYVEDAFYAAIGKLGLTKSDKTRQDRTNKNRVDAASRLAGTSERAPTEEHIRRDSKPMTRQEAIRAAIEAVEKGD